MGEAELDRLLGEMEKIEKATLEITK